MATDVLSRKWLISEESFDEEQNRIKTLKQGNYLIEGCAGSGKTVLALTKAYEIKEAELGSYLVVIFTHTLKTFIKDGITNLGLDEDRICNYDQLEKRGYTNADYIIVDEVQDFQDERIEKLVKMANKHFIFFGDDAQQIYSERTGNTSLRRIARIAKIDANNYKKLSNNYRLPKPIAEFAVNIAKKPNPGIVGKCVKSSGKRPVVIKCNSSEEELDYIRRIIEDNGLLNVGILVKGNAEVRDVIEYYKKVNFEVQYKYNSGQNGKGNVISTLDFYEHTPKIITYHSSKGLQFDHVFLPMCDVSYTKYDIQDALYVAVTRTSEELYITHSKPLSPYIQRINSKLYD
jgi:superfamily I DNA/RNA helicase